MKSDFVVALHVMGFLTATQGKPLSSEILAATYGTNPVVIRRILSQLKEAGLITSQRGVGGGSVLAEDPHNVSLRRVYEAVTESSLILPRHPGTDSEVSEVLSDYINQLCASAEAALLAQLETVTIAEMDEEVRPAICALVEAKKLPS